MKLTLFGTLPATAAAAALFASGFAITAAAAQTDQQPTHAELDSIGRRPLSTPSSRA
jgi:hypothetical protein